MAKSLRLRLWDFLREKKSLVEIYEAFEEKESTIRGRLNENIGICFKRLGRESTLQQTEMCKPSSSTGHMGST